jgi:hypothetical protein
MRQILLFVAMALASSPSSSQARPDFSGTWKLKATSVSEVHIIEHKEPDIHLLMKIEDEGGKRSLDVRGKIDGKEHKQVVQGAPATFIAWWEGESLVLDLRRETPVGILHNVRKLKLSKDGKEMTTERTKYLPTPKRTWTETWTKL